jgi:hypothetical protein
MTPEERLAHDATTSARTTARRARRTREIGSDAACPCGYRNPVGLVLTERHHPLGQNHEPGLTIAVCQNCHAELHEELRAAGIDLKKDDSCKNTLVSVLQALAVFFIALAAMLRTWAQRVQDELCDTANPRVLA